MCPIIVVPGLSRFGPTCLVRSFDQPSEFCTSGADSEHVLARHPSKTAIGKLYRQNSKGSKLDMVLRSRLDTDIVVNLSDVWGDPNWGTWTQ